MTLCRVTCYLGTVLGHRARSDRTNMVLSTYYLEVLPQHFMLTTQLWCVAVVPASMGHTGYRLWFAVSCPQDCPGGYGVMLNFAVLGCRSRLFHMCQHSMSHATVATEHHRTMRCYKDTGSFLLV